MLTELGTLPNILLIVVSVACGGANTPVETGGEEQCSVGDTMVSQDGNENDCTCVAEGWVCTGRANVGDDEVLNSGEIPPHCISVAGCPNAQPIPACENVVETMAADDVLNQWASLDGQTVHVLGRLSIQAGLCTQQECGPENSCCNSCGGQLTPFSMGEVELDNSEQRFSCQGDDSGQCCGYAVPVENVRTSGRPGVDSHGFRHLYDTVVCIP